MAEFNLADLYQAAFGYIAKPKPAGIGGGAQVQLAQGYDRLDRVEIDKRGGKEGLYGTWIAMPVKLGDLYLPNEPLVSVNLAKMIVETAIDGNDGTFKENYSNGDYQVEIKGLAINDDDPDNYPADIMRGIRGWIEKRTHIPITCALTTLFNINHVAVKGCSFPAYAGDIGVQPYELHCASDREFKLKYRTA